MSICVYRAPRLSHGTAAFRGIGERDWLMVTTPNGLLGIGPQGRPINSELCCIQYRRAPDGVENTPRPGSAFVDRRICRGSGAMRRQTVFVSWA